MSRIRNAGQFARRCGLCGCCAGCGRRGGVGWASIPDSGGFIHGCYKTGGTNHKLSIIDDSVTANCPHGYTSLNWSTGQCSSRQRGQRAPTTASSTPVGSTSATVEAWGGGGGGGGGGAGSEIFNGGQGGMGGEGAYIRALVSLTPGTTYYVSVGGGGSGGFHGSNNEESPGEVNPAAQAHGRRVGTSPTSSTPSAGMVVTGEHLHRRIRHPMGAPGNPGLGGGSTWGQGTTTITAQTGSTGSSSQGQDLVGAGGSGGAGGSQMAVGPRRGWHSREHLGFVIVNFGPTT